MYGYNNEVLNGVIGSMDYKLLSRHGNKISVLLAGAYDLLTELKEWGIHTETGINFRLKLKNLFNINNGTFTDTSCLTNFYLTGRANIKQDNYEKALNMLTIQVLPFMRSITPKGYEFKVNSNNCQEVGWFKINYLSSKNPENTKNTVTV